MERPKLDPDFRDMLFELSNAGVEFMVVGGHAMAIHHRARYTRDMDIWVRCTPENARRTWEALRKFGAPLPLFNEADFTDPNNVVQIGVPPLRIDILMSIQGVSFEEAWPHRVLDEIEGRPIPFIGRDALIKNKQAVARPQDIADVQNLLKSRPTRP